MARQQIILAYAEPNLLGKNVALESKNNVYIPRSKTYRNTDGLVLKTCHYKGQLLPYYTEGSLILRRYEVAGRLRIRLY